jgi:anti-anti-sigma regulatory factor
MAFYTIRDSDNAQATLKIEGIVTSVDWEALREFCLHALQNKESVVLDLTDVCAYDFSLTVFVCLLRRTVQLLGKQISITGRQKEFVCLYSKGVQCPNIEASASCWCENLFDMGDRAMPHEGEPQSLSAPQSSSIDDNAELRAPDTPDSGPSDTLQSATLSGSLSSS